MDSRDVACQKEGDVRSYYQKFGAEAGIPGLSRIFDMLCDDEARHADALRALQKGVRVELPQSPTLEGARSILRRLDGQEALLSEFNGDLRSYGMAMVFEAANVRICGQMAQEARQGWEKELLLKIVADDEVHFTLLEYMRELLQPYSGVQGGRAGVSDAH